MKALILCVLTGCAVLFLMGCDSDPQYVKSPVHVPIDLMMANYEANDVAVGISNTGQIRIAMSICPRPPSTDEYCDLMYFYPDRDTQWHHYEWSDDPYHMRSPDITVTDDGTGFITFWQQLLGSNSLDRYWRTDTLAIYHVWGSPPSYYSDEPPKVASNGNTVYVVSAVYDEIDHSTRLRYKQIYGGVSEGWVSPVITDGEAYMIGQGFNIAVSPAGKVYVTWRNINGIYANNNSGTTGNMTQLNTIYNFPDLSIPSIAVSDNVADPYLWIVYVDFSPTSHTDSDNVVIYNCDTTNCAATAQWYYADLGATLHWDVRNEPKVEGYGRFAYVAFSADNDNPPAAPNGHEIYLLEFNTDTDSEIRTQITDDMVGDSTPVLALVNDRAVVAWRRTLSDGYGDVYMYDQKWGVRMLYMSEAGLSKMDIAGNGIYGAGAWLEEEWFPTPIRVDMYYTYNSLVTYLPFLTVP